MEITLPAFSVVLVVISKSCALDKVVINLSVGHVWVIILEVGQHLVGGGHDIWSLLLKKVLGNVRDYSERNLLAYQDCAKIQCFHLL